MSPFQSRHFDHHEQVSFHADEASGLRLVVAIHSIGPLGMAGGGCRIVRYACDDDAVDDALRLSRDMSYKLALAGIPSGGAKAVVIGVPERERRREVLLAVGRVVEQLRGRYVIAEDVGTTPEDMRVIARETNYVLAHCGDSGLATARGTLRGLELSVHRALGRDLAGVRVGIQGVGRVGSILAKELKQRGAELWICDLDPARAEAVAREVGAEQVDTRDFAALEVDVLAPCALGDVFDGRNVSEVKAKVIAGSANNVLSEPAVAEQLRQRGILYAPDFVINMGGVIGSGQSEPKALERIDATLAEVFDLAEREVLSTHEVAERLARRALAAMKER